MRVTIIQLWSSVGGRPNASKVVTISNSVTLTYSRCSPTLTFDSSNWNLEQTVQVLARADSDSTVGTATLVLSADGISSTSVPLTEFDSGTNTQTELYRWCGQFFGGIEGVEISFSTGGSVITDQGSLCP